MGLLLIGGLLVINQQMNLGQFVASEIVILLVINAVEKLILSTETIYDVLTSLEKIGHVTDLPLQKNGQRMLSEPSEGIAVELDRISFTFPGDMKPTLSKIDMNVQSGNRVLIRGTSNSGKATLLKVMCGLLSPTEGLLRVNEYSFSTIDYDSLYQYTGVYLRSESLFDGTLYENISLGREGLKEEDVKNTLFDLGLEKWFRQLDLGMETSVCSNGQDYSQALVSKLLMARAICHKPKLLVLENPISSFDSKEAESILTFLLDKKHPWTLIMSSNNSLMEPSRFDQAIVLDGGEIISKTN
jgi:ABC-type bacteriocin/lantibiotic exporter with double-glycine peptidase domain